MEAKKASRKLFSVKKLKELEEEFLASETKGLSFVQWLEKFYAVPSKSEVKKKTLKKQIDEDAQVLLRTYILAYTRLFERSPLVYGNVEINELRAIMKSSNYTVEWLQCLIVAYLNIKDTFLERAQYPLKLFWRHIGQSESEVEGDGLWLVHTEDKDFQKEYLKKHLGNDTRELHKEI